MPQAGLFIIERGVGWRWLVSLEQEYRDGVVVIAPEPGESEALLGARVTRRWRDLRRSGVNISVAGLVCSVESPEPALLTRATRARRLQAALAEEGGGCLVLVAESPSLRHELIAIAGVLPPSPLERDTQIRILTPGASYRPTLGVRSRGGGFRASTASWLPQPS